MENVNVVGLVDFFLSCPVVLRIGGGFSFWSGEKILIGLICHVCG
jgi:hypothetical protein